MPGRTIPTSPFVSTAQAIAAQASSIQPRFTGGPPPCASTNDSSAADMKKVSPMSSVRYWLERK
jgi:hypothetical protein